MTQFNIGDLVERIAGTPYSAWRPLWDEIGLLHISNDSTLELPKIPGIVLAHAERTRIHEGNYWFLVLFGDVMVFVVECSIKLCA